MHIGILTLPLNTNYGGILQAYALSTYLQEQGHTTKIITRRKTQRSLLLHAAAWLKWTSVPFLTTFGKIAPIQLLATEYFKQSHLSNLTKPLFSSRALIRLCKEENFDLIIVGSDQTWNRTAAPDLFNYYLDFCDQLPNVSRASYACSFAKSVWDYTEDERERCKELLEKFTAISVREEDGRSIVSEKYQKTAQVHVDPTFLFDQFYYRKLADLAFEEGYCFNYILDKSDQKTNISLQVSTKLELKSRTICDSFHSVATVERWLGLVANSNFVMTDSYHGVVFAIIFRKPFFVIRNDKRGGTRFTSLLSNLGLMNRMINPDQLDITERLELTIDWISVEKRLAHWIDESKSYIKSITTLQ